ncbi:MAG TPA: DUF979 domain-containing protein [Opitutaceae bacterium]|jgi:uncharacterized membrane protein|nr:DUF979 domain-containing protein [Opitutaceae bacterium]
MTLLSLNSFYAVGGAFMLVNAGCVAVDKEHGSRWTTALFWSLLGLSFVLGGSLSPTAVGYMVLGMGALAAAGKIEKSRARTTTKEERIESSGRLGNRLFVPALVVPVTAVLGTLVLGHVHWRGYSLVDPAYLSITSVCIGAVLALVIGLRLTRAPIRAPIVEGSRLLQSVGWALILPQALAALGGLFSKAGVGVLVASLVERSLPTQYPTVAVAAYCLGMFLFTICMGNAFAAFAVITGGIGVPFIVQAHGGNPAVMAAIGMLAGYCGTLVTPMAANFNLVPVMLLELEDKNAVIKAQVPIALALLGFNLLLMEFCVYRF